MTVKVFINPNYVGVPPQADNGGIRRVVEAEIEHLHKFGVEVVANPKDADVIQNHGGALTEVPGTPMVSTSHGLYWSRQPWAENYQEVNAQLMESMRRSVAWTAPSDWVNTAIRRGAYFYPETVYHGIDGDKFLPSKTHGNYILWNKARADFVSDPNDVMNAALALPGREFISTIGHSDDNLKIVGVKSHPEMKKLVAEAGVYLATTRETFGIGTLEAMAYGVPIAGFDWGGQHEIIIPGQTGYLAPPGDFKTLAECIEKCLTERDRLSKNAIADVRSRWKWEPRIEQYANIFKRVHKCHNKTNQTKVSVIVTAYKLDQFLPQCLDSVIKQTFSDFECIVIDDANLASTKMIVSEYARRDNRFSYLSTPQNMGLPGARNFGQQNSNGLYIRHLDADDFLAENALELEVAALDKNREFDVVYGHLETVNEDGSRILDGRGQAVRSGWPEPKFNWFHQMAHLNQLPSCSMARRDVYERSGGYRERMKRQEDAEFWCRISSFGFRIGKFTEAVTYFHRQRRDSKGQAEWNSEGKEPDWTAWFPWRMGGTDFHSARDVIRKLGNAVPRPQLVPFGAQGTAELPRRFWYVHDYAYPVVSVVVTCGPGHKKYLMDALDSVQAQTYPDWECVVVNDTGEAWPSDIMGAPWAKVVNMPVNSGASAARNEGYKHTKGKYIIWLDADDYWTPWFLEKMVSYAEHNRGVIYSDFIQQNSDKEFKLYKYIPDFDSRALLQGCAMPGSSILVPRWAAEAVMEKRGGWDVEIPGMEDWDFQIALDEVCSCFYHIQEPLFVYRTYSTTKREADYSKIAEIAAYIEKKWEAYRKGERKMCGCTAGKKPPSNQPSSLLSSSGNFSDASLKTVLQNGDKRQMVAVEYLGTNEGTFTIRSKIQNGIVYRFGNNEGNRAKTVLLGDAEFLAALADAHGIPQYRIIGTSAALESYDPAGFIGQPISV